MTLTDAERRSPIGLLWAAVAMVAFSANDVIVKFLSGDYALYQLMFIRSLTGVLVVAFILAPLSGASLKTKRLGLHIVRGLCVVFANFMFFSHGFTSVRRVGAESPWRITNTSFGCVEHSAMNAPVWPSSERLNPFRQTFF